MTQEPTGLTRRLFVVIETIEPAALARVGDRFERDGRMLPDGVEYIDSWMEKSGRRCVQIMRAADRTALDAWTARWSDLVHFEINEVLTSAQFWARAKRAREVGGAT